MAKVIQIEVPEDVDVELFKKEIERALGRTILIKELESIDVDERVIDEIAEDIKKSGWKRIEKWLKLIQTLFSECFREERLEI